jgi:hypothetical protein
MKILPRPKVRRKESSNWSHSLWYRLGSQAWCEVRIPSLKKRVWGQPYPNYLCYKEYIYIFNVLTFTYDHRVRNTGLPVRSAILKPHAGMLVVGSVTTSESVLLYVFEFFLNMRCILK